MYCIYKKTTGRVLIIWTNTFIAFCVRLYSNEKLFGVQKTPFIRYTANTIIVRIIYNVHKFTTKTRIYGSCTIAYEFGCRFRGETFVSPNTITTKPVCDVDYARVHNLVTVENTITRGRAKTILLTSKNKRVVVSISCLPTFQCFKLFTTTTSLLINVLYTCIMCMVSLRLRTRTRTRLRANDFINF